ncbi:MAG: hypothetical protein V4519_02735 [Patescibacteria group bacterium]
MAKQTPYIPLGILGNQDSVGIFARTDAASSKFIILWKQKDGSFAESLEFEDISISLPHGTKENPAHCSTFSISEHEKMWTATYIRIKRGTRERVIATSIDLIKWLIVSEVAATSDDVVLAESSDHTHKYHMFSGGTFTRLAYSKNLHTWVKAPGLIMTYRQDFFDQDVIKLMGSYETLRGTLLFYDSSYLKDEQWVIQVGAVLLDKHTPTKILWRAFDPLWKATLTTEHFTDMRPLGLVEHTDATVSLFWTSAEGYILSTRLDVPTHALTHSLHTHPKVDKSELKKHHKNPVLSPALHLEWTAGGTFNPAAFRDSQGKVHLIYRAVGADGVSRLGYSGSTDGLMFDDHHEQAVFAMENPRLNVDPEFRKYDPVMYPSGGSWGGCEDPRMVAIDNKVYVTFSAFEGWDSIRIGVSSISLKNFLSKKWRWSKPLLISPLQKINKNWVLFPEKINGKFAILHNISPTIEVDYVNKLEDLATGKVEIKSNFGKRKPQASWDTYVRGVGPPPLKTDKGWLVLYHAIDKREPDQYKLGAMLLDLKDPKKILARAPAPLLEPNAWYENDWKPGVVYACGAVIENDTLYVYYGGGDKHICVATAPLQELLDKVIKNKEFTLKPEKSIAI